MKWRGVERASKSYNSVDWHWIPKVTVAYREVGWIRTHHNANIRQGNMNKGIFSHDRHDRFDAIIG